MKKMPVCLITFLLCALMLTAPAVALAPGDPLGWVLHSDITASIDGHPIRSYNIGGNTYVVAEDLMQYGFRVEWNAAARQLIIHTDRTASPDAYTADYTPVPGRYPAGTPAMPYLYTDITVRIGEMPVIGYNIGGYTCVGMDDLAAVFAEEYVWDAAARELRLSSAPKTYAWEHVYEAPDYDKDTAVDGVYAIWKFVKNEAGEFELASREGDVLFTPQLSFGGDFVNYTIHLVDKTMYNQFHSAPHTLLVHTKAGLFLRDTYDGWWHTLTMPDGTVVCAEKFAEYAASNPAVADYLREQCAKLRESMRVWYNDEPIDLIGLIDPAESLNVPGYRHLVWRNYQLIFSKTYALEDVDTVRIEFRLPDDAK